MKKIYRFVLWLGLICVLIFGGLSVVVFGLNQDGLVRSSMSSYASILKRDAILIQTLKSELTDKGIYLFEKEQIVLVNMIGMTLQESGVGPGDYLCESLVELYGVIPELSDSKLVLDKWRVDVAGVKFVNDFSGCFN